MKGADKCLFWFTFISLDGKLASTVCMTGDVSARSDNKVEQPLGSVDEIRQRNADRLGTYHN